MAIDLYYVPSSPPCRLVLLVAAALNVELNLTLMDIRAGDHMKADFLKLNPQHTVPTMVDDGFPLWESHTIARYLANKHGPTSLYPEDPKTRALVDHRMDFDLGSLYSSFAEYFYPFLSGMVLDEDLLEKLTEKIIYLNQSLDGHTYAVGSELTIADLSLVATVSTIEASGVLNLAPYKNVVRWFELVKSTAPNYKEANQKGVDDFKKLVAETKRKSEL